MRLWYIVKRLMSESIRHGNGGWLPVSGKGTRTADALCSMLDREGFKPEDSASGLKKKAGKITASER